MPAELVAEETVTVGQPFVVDGKAPNTRYGAAFEDDGTTGYFYGLDFSRRDQPIVDARYICDVERVTDRSIPSMVQIVFSTDGLKTALIINNHPHAVIDFAARRSYCRSGFPPPSREWSAHDAEWDAAAVELFR